MAKTTIDAMGKIINTENKYWEAKTLEVPERWLGIIFDGDGSHFYLFDDGTDWEAYEAFCKGELSDGWMIADQEEESSFSSSHDATSYGVLPCSVVKCLAVRKKTAI